MMASTQTSKTLKEVRRCCSAERMGNNRTVISLQVSALLRSFTPSLVKNFRRIGSRDAVASTMRRSPTPSDSFCRSLASSVPKWHCPSTCRTQRSVSQGNEGERVQFCVFWRITEYLREQGVKFWELLSEYFHRFQHKFLENEKQL